MVCAGIMGSMGSVFFSKINRRRRKNFIVSRSFVVCVFNHCTSSQYLKVWKNLSWK